MNRQSEVRQFLLGMFKCGVEIPQKRVLTAAEIEGFTLRQLRRAKRKLGIASRKKGISGGWQWVLRSEGSEKV